MTEEYVTNTGKILTESDVYELAIEAERGYEVQKWPPADPQRMEQVAQRFAAIVAAASEDDRIKIRRNLEQAADNPFAKRVLELLR